MKIIIILSFLVSIGFSQTGKDFLDKYPFDKTVDEMSKKEHWQYLSYTNRIEGIIMGNAETVNRMHGNSEVYEIYFLPNRVCGMEEEQKITFLRTWLKNNPESINNGFHDIIFSAFMELPMVDGQECIRLIEERIARNPLSK